MDLHGCRLVEFKLFASCALCHVRPGMLYYPRNVKTIPVASRWGPLSELATCGKSNLLFNSQDPIMSITLLQGRHLSKLVIILISFWFSACFIFAAYKLRLRIGFANFGDLGIFKGVEGVQKIQLCGSGNDIGRVNILKTASNKYDRLLEAKFTFVNSFIIPFKPK